jgi:hypothetical protein
MAGLVAVLGSGGERSPARMPSNRETPMENRWLKVLVTVVFGAAIASWAYFTFFGFHWA